ncbi:MAG: hypothetical protein ACLFQM_11770 [Fidelibacterota bacterium]
MQSKYEIIKDALLNKKQIHATYNGYHREMCPYVIGIKNGVEHALFYQFGGNSESGLDTLGSDKNWRCIEIEKLKDIIVKNGYWYTATNRSMYHTCVDEIDEEVY